jgi:predicted type IV restriction endonuclease
MKLILKKEFVFMAISIPKKVQDRITAASKKYLKIISDAVKADINESDTVLIIHGMLTDIFGYERFTEITTEYAIKNIFCDIAVKIDGKPKYIIEVKAVGTKLNENHLNQATMYCTKEGLEYALLSNAQTWKVYKIDYNPPVKINQVFEINWLTENLKDTDFLERVFCLCKEGIIKTKTAISIWEEEKQATNKHILGAIILGESVLREIRKEVKRISDYYVKLDELRAIIREEVLKREIVDGEEAVTATKRYKTSVAKEMKQKEKETQTYTP